MAQMKTRIALRNDSTANWQANSNVVLMKGEIGIEFTDNGETKMKLGDGLKTWAALDYFGGETGVRQTQVYQADLAEGENDIEAIIRVVGGNALFEGDMAIVKSAIGEAITYTAYVYNDAKWQAMNGNYNADNIYFDRDLFTTKEIGYITLQNGSANIPATGKNLTETWEQIFVKEENPIIILPEVSFTQVTTGSYEVGTSITPIYAAKMSTGSYQYGPETGLTANSWNVNLRKDDILVQNKTTAEGTFSTIVLADGDKYIINAEASYDNAAIPVTNKGNPYAAGQIKAGRASKTSNVISSYRNTFYGTTTDKNILDSTTIRALNKTNKASKAGDVVTIDLPVGAVRVVFAYPATLRDITSVKDINGLNAEIVSAFKKETITVAGAGNDAGISYKVFTTEFASPLEKANSYKVTI